MAMTIREADAEDTVLVDINTTPLIDVMLVLLIMLIITIPLQTGATRMALPAGPAETVVRPVVEVAIAADGMVSWDGAPVPDAAALAARMRLAAEQQPQPDIHLRPDRAVAYRHVIAVLAAAQRLGVARIGLVGTAAFAD